MIVSASRRTDVPALYPAWLRQRLAQGRARVVHPFRPSLVRTVDLRPPPAGTMDALVLWTRTPGPLLGDLPEWERRGIRSVWLVTVTGYPPAIEPHAPPERAALAALEELSRRVGAQRVAWRYDPVLFVPELGIDPAWHRRNFERLAGRLSGRVDRCVLSLYDPYRAPEGRFRRAGLHVHTEGGAELARDLAGIAARHGIPMRTCCEDLEDAGIPPGACIDGPWLRRLWGVEAGARKDPGQRAACRCAPSVDIGAYDTCVHGCLYCYATHARHRASARHRAHDPTQETLG